jgi:hypothetical protein
MKTSSIILTILGSLWILAIIVGTFVLMKYEYTPGIANKPDTQWPNDSQIPLSKERSTLVMFAHPQCSCTRASIAELGRLIAHCKIQPKSYLLFISPKSMPFGWEKTDLWHSAQTIPGVTVLSDIDGIEAHRFNSVTSGQTMIYDTKGKLIFSGGITGSRGQEGDNLGLNSAILALQAHLEKNQTTSVFGCSLVSSNSK